jgi:hypothetical protein
MNGDQVHGAGPLTIDRGRLRPALARAGRPWLAVLVAAVVVVTGVAGVAAPVAAAPAIEVTGVSVGGASVALPIPATVSSFNYSRADLATFEGSVIAYFPELDWFEITREVDGVGPVTLEVKAGFPKATAYGLSAFMGDVDAGGVLSMPPATEPSLRFQVREVTHGGATTAVTCWLNGTGVVGSGQATTDGVSVRHEAVLGAATSTCGGHAPVIEAALAGPASVDLWFPGSNLIASEDVPSQLAVTPLATGGTVHDRIAVDVQVTYAPTGTEIGAPGTVRIYDDGALVGTGTLGVSGYARIYLDLATPGDRHYEVVYGGRLAGSVGFPLPSDGSFDLDVAPFPTGRPLSGAVTVKGVPSAMPAGAVWTGADYDPVNGALGDGALASPVGAVSLPGVLLGGTIVAQLRLIQVDEVGGQVRPDGTVDLDPVQFRVDARSATVAGDLRSCLGAPFEVQFQGTADASGLHLTADGLTTGPVPAGSCAGHGDNINLALGGASVDLEFHVAGDFTPPEVVETQVAVRSWFGEVAQFNQTILLSQVQAVGSGPVATGTGAAPVSSGTVAFADGDQVLATVPVVGGVANAVVALPFAGSRVITATYSGAGRLDSSSSSTPVLVTPAPTGPAIVGGLTVAGWEVAPGAAGVVTGPLGAGGATSWAPVVLEGDVGGGSSTAEVRLLQVGDFAGHGPDLQATFVVHVRAVSAGGTTVLPLGCVTLVTVDLVVDGDGVLTVSSGSSARMATGGCRNPLASAWTDALSGPINGSLAPAG